MFFYAVMVALRSLAYFHSDPNSVEYTTKPSRIHDMNRAITEGSVPEKPHHVPGHQMHSCIVVVDDVFVTITKLGHAHSTFLAKPYAMTKALAYEFNLLSILVNSEKGRAQFQIFANGAQWNFVGTIY